MSLPTSPIPVRTPATLGELANDHLTTPDEKATAEERATRKAAAQSLYEWTKGTLTEATVERWPSSSDIEVAGDQLIIRVGTAIVTVDIKVTHY